MIAMRKFRKAYRTTRGTPWAGLFAVCLLLAGCGDETAPPSINDPAQLPWRIELNHRAITLSTQSPYDTIRLQGVLLNPFGNAMPGFPAVSFSTRSPDIELGDDGSIRALSSTAAAEVTVSATYQNLTIADTVFVRVTTETSPVPLGSLRFVRTDGDTIKPVANAGEYGEPVYPTSLPIQALNGNMQVISDPLVVYWSADKRIAEFPIHRMSYGGSTNRGVVNVYVEGTIYGVKKRDSIPWLADGPYRFEVTIATRTLAADTAPQLYFNPEHVVVKAGGIVLWSSSSADKSTDIVFDDPSNIEAVTKVPVGVWYYDLPSLTDRGNIAEFVMPPGKFLAIRGRRFTQPGTYRYHSTRYGTTGVVVVR